MVLFFPYTLAFKRNNHLVTDSWEQTHCSFILICLIKAVTSKKHRSPKNGCIKKFKKRKRISGILQVQRTNRFYSATIQTGDISLRSNSPWKIKSWFELRFFKAVQEEYSMGASIIWHQQVNRVTQIQWIWAMPFTCANLCKPMVSVLAHEVSDIQVMSSNPGS
jgi:hypothetical protein